MAKKNLPPTANHGNVIARHKNKGLATMAKHRAALTVDQNTDLAERNVTMSNALTRAGHGLTLSEKRLIAACIAQNDSFSREQLRNRALPCITRLNAHDYAKLYDVSLPTAYEQLQDGAKNLFERKITTRRETRHGYEIYQCRWVGAARYHEGEGWVELHWWHEVVPHLYGLREHFTTYKLKHASALRSANSWRLFELFQSWKETGHYTPTIEQFHRAMDATPTQRANFGELRRRVIEPAVKELTEKHNLIIQWTTVNAGRKVVGLDFTFETDPQQKLL